MPLPGPLPGARKLWTVIALGAIVLPAGCGGQSERVPLERPAAPVVSSTARLPLSTPPMYWVRPGDRGAATTATAERRPVRDEAPPVRTGEEALLSAAGARRADPSIRRDLSRMPGIAVLPEGMLESLIAAGPGNVPGLPAPERRGSRPLGE